MACHVECAPFAHLCFLMEILMCRGLTVQLTSNDSEDPSHAARQEQSHVCFMWSSMVIFSLQKTRALAAELSYTNQSENLLKDFNVFEIYCMNLWFFYHFIKINQGAQA